LHVSASVWFEANGFPDEAINHALQAEDFERAARLITRDNGLIIYSRSISVWVKWLQSFPDEFVRSNPWLCIWKAHFLLTNGELKTIPVYIDCAEKILADMLGTGALRGDDPAYLIAQGDAYSFRAILANAENRSESALDFAQKAIQIIPPSARNRAFAVGIPMTIHRKTGDLRRALEVCPKAIASARLLNVASLDTSIIDIQAKMLRELGQLHQSARVLREALAYAEDHGPLYRLYSDVLHVSLAETYYEWNALEEMDAEVENALALSAQVGTKNEIIIGQIARCQLQHARGDLPGACKALEQIELEYRNFLGSAWRDAWTALRHHWQMEEGDLTGLADWIGQVDLNVEARFNTSRFTKLMDACRVLDVLGRHEEARDILNDIHAVVERQGHLGWSIPVLVLQSLVCKKLGDEARALDCLQQALILAEPEGFVRVFLDEGPSMRELLSRYQKQRGRSDYLTCLLAAFEDRPTMRPAPAAGGLPEPLSGRELEVVKLLAQGCSDKQIAADLFIARETVHKHLKNIYGKLGVHNRTEAAARARELGLL
jgi:LuxR family maltose regulon positive regulatory protein